MSSENQMPKQLFLVEAEAIEEVLRRAVRHALLMHKRAGNPIAVWKDDRVVLIPAELITVEEDDES
jgi:hypothetical protein